MIWFAAKHTQIYAHSETSNMFDIEQQQKNENSCMYEQNKSVYIRWGWGGLSMKLPNAKKNVHEWHFSVFLLIAFALTENPARITKWRQKEQQQQQQQQMNRQARTPLRRKIQNEISNYAPRTQSIRKSIKGCSIHSARVPSIFLISIFQLSFSV